MISLIMYGDAFFFICAVVFIWLICYQSDAAFDNFFQLEVFINAYLLLIWKLNFCLLLKVDLKYILCATI